MPIVEGNFELIEVILQFIGVFVSFSIAYVSYRGVKQTESSTLMRLATAFGLLGGGFMVEGIVGLGGLFPQMAGWTAAMVVMGLALETLGYFFLAFSHAIDVVLARRLGIALLIVPVISLSGTQVADVLSIASFYFVAYGVVETLYAYARNRNPDTLLIAGGLGLIAFGTFFQWLSILYLSVNLLPLVEIIMKEMGLMILFVPVLRFTFGRVRIDGPV